MNKFNFYQFLSILSIVFILIGCNSKMTNNVQSYIPKLLDRNENLRMGKEWDDVMGQYQKLKIAITKNPSDHESKIRMAQLCIREARVTGEHGHYYNGALAMTEQVLKSSNLDLNMEFLALVTKAGVQLSHHDFAGALITGQKALIINPNNPQIYGVLVDAHVELGQYEKAVILADKMISLKPDLRSYARISYIREIHGQVDQSFEAMNMAVSAGVPGYEDTAWAMLTLADLYKLYGQQTKAKALYEEILAQRPNYPFAISGLGDIALENKDLQLAEKLTKQAMDIIPEVGFYTQMAIIYKSQGRCQELEKITKEIFTMLEDDEKSGHNMNLEYASFYNDILENPISAMAYAQKEYKKRPANIDVNRMMAKISNQLDQDASEYIAAASSTNSKHPELRNE
jgi:tetratricopeptide (TPR) repeat protein